MGSTKKELIQDLQKKPYSLDRERIIKRARQGTYHDFETKLATPKMQLVSDLRYAGYEDLAERTIDGAYDDERPTLEQAEELRAEVGPELYDSVMGARRRPKA